MQGIFSALPVAFDKNGNIMEKGLREIIRYNIDVMKIDGLYVNGSTGETFMLYPKEKKRILEITIDEVNNQIPLIAQVGSLNVKEAVELGKHATELGYKTLSAVTPFYFKFTLEEVKNYYKTIIDETGNNMIIYCIPSKTGVVFDLPQMQQIVGIDGVSGIKYTHNDFFLLERLRKEYPNKSLFFGMDQMQINAMPLGVNGSIGTTFNLIGSRAKKIFNLSKEGKIKEAAELQSVQNDFIQHLAPFGLFQGLKGLLKLKGVNAGYCRAPFMDLPDSKLDDLKKLLKYCD